MTTRILLHIITLAALTRCALARCSPLRRSPRPTPTCPRTTGRTRTSRRSPTRARRHNLLDDYGTAFKPERAITRELLARSLVLASGHYGENITPVDIKDVPEGYRYYTVIQMALHHGYMSLDADGTSADGDGAGDQAEAAIDALAQGAVRLVRLVAARHARAQPLAAQRGWKTGAPSYLPYVVASRQLQLRYNHSRPATATRRAHRAHRPRRDRLHVLAAYAVGGEWHALRARRLQERHVPGAQRPSEGDRALRAHTSAIPTSGAASTPPDSPYGYQEAGGFDCSGFVFYVMKMHFGYHHGQRARRPRHGRARQAAHHAQAAQVRRPHLLRAQGPESRVESIYHAALYLGRAGSSTRQAQATASRWPRWTPRATGRGPSPGAGGCSRRPSSVPSPSPSAAAMAQPAQATTPSPESAVTPTPEAPAASPSASVTPAPASSAPAQP